MKKFLALSLSDVVFIMLINVKMPTIVGILTFMSRINFVLSCVEHEKSFITSRPGPFVFPSVDLLCYLLLNHWTKSTRSTEMLDLGSMGPLFNTHWKHSVVHALEQDTLFSASIQEDKRKCPYMTLKLLTGT